MIVKEHMSSCNFNFNVMFNEFDQPEVEDDGELNLFGAVSVDFDDKFTTSIESILAAMHANANDESMHYLLKADLLAEFEHTMKK